jgi:hypothetical protein
MRDSASNSHINADNALALPEPFDTARCFALYSPYRDGSLLEFIVYSDLFFLHTTNLFYKRSSVAMLGQRK